MPSRILLFLRATAAQFCEDCWSTIWFLPTLPCFEYTSLSFPWSHWCNPSLVTECTSNWFLAIPVPLSLWTCSSFFRISLLKLSSSSSSRFKASKACYFFLVTTAACDLNIASLSPWVLSLLSFSYICETSLRVFIICDSRSINSFWVMGGSESIRSVFWSLRILSLY